jgi:phosphonate transport system substrate-binding protein
MRHLWIVIALCALLVAPLLALLVYLSHSTSPSSPGRSAGPATTPATSAAGPELRIGLVPEWDIFEQHRRYRALADYLSVKLRRPVKLVTLNTYQTILQDFADKEVEAAFLGSFVAVLTMDRQGARPVAKPEFEDGISTYTGVLIVPESSPIKSVEDLSGRSVAMLRTTTAGNLFPVYAMVEHKLLAGPNPPKMVWVGTFDDVIRETVEGRVDAGAVKNLRLDAYLKAHPEAKIRRLAEGPEAPNMAMVVRADVADSLGPLLWRALQGMECVPEGKEALKRYGAQRFLPCDVTEFKAIYDMVDKLGPAWDQLGVTGPPPRYPRELTGR